MVQPELTALTEMHGVTFAAHILAGAVFVYLAYTAHERTVPVLYWILPLGFAALVIAGDWTAAFEYGIRLGYTGIIVAATGAVLGSGFTVAVFKPEKNRSRASSEFEI